tara:strand:+ start:1655 stop:1798 length:144 start_codon:yes stop_codon:yes gene_type:complete
MEVKVEMSTDNLKAQKCVLDKSVSTFFAKEKKSFVKEWKMSDAFTIP